MAAIKWLIDKLGVAAIHPDDGWVNRKENTVHLVYPRYKAEIVHGSLIALGQPWSGYRIVKVIEPVKCSFGNDDIWLFSEIWENPLKRNSSSNQKE